MADDPALLGVEDLRIGFGGAPRAVDGISFSVAAGEFLCIVGESGSGKSLSLLATLGLLRATGATVEGSIRYRGRDLLALPTAALRRLRGREIAMIFQDPMAAMTPVLTIGAQITEQIRAHTRLSREAARQRALALLEEMGLPDPPAQLRRYPHQLSGGQRQRAMIAMALSCDPALLLADEPTTALDASVQAQILRLLLRLRQTHGSAIILVTHDMGVVAETADTVAVVYAGRVVEHGPAADVLRTPWHPYTWALLAAIPPVVGPPPTRLFAIPGAPPTPATRPPGCPFAPRCPHRFDPCGAPPPLLRHGRQHAACFLPEAEAADRRAAAWGGRGAPAAGSAGG